MTDLDTDCQLDREIDSGNDGVLRHLGQIADSMDKWEGAVAEHLGLTIADSAAIKVEHPNRLDLQM